MMYDVRFAIDDLRFGICDLGFGIWDLGFGIWDLTSWCLVTSQLGETPSDIRGISVFGR